MILHLGQRGLMDAVTRMVSTLQISLRLEILQENDLHCLGLIWESEMPWQASALLQFLSVGRIRKLIVQKEAAC
jgi:hypothetical protein